MTCLDYCQYLLVTQINYTLTNFADHSSKFSHDKINRFLKGEKITPRLIWDNVESQLVLNESGYLIFDDTVLDKNYSFNVELVRRQAARMRHRLRSRLGKQSFPRGNAKRVIKGIGVVTCIYVNPMIDQFWLIDYRIYEPDNDGKTKLEHPQDMLLGAVHHKQIPFQGILMDTWYATKNVMLLIESLNKHYYCPLKNNRQVDESAGFNAYQRVDSLDWNDEELKQGKIIKIKGFPKEHKVKLFRVEVSSRGHALSGLPTSVSCPYRTDYVVTNDLTQVSTKATHKACGFRWRIEQLHREGKQLTGWEKCQCRKVRIQRNHIGCALLVWVRLKNLALVSNSNVYQLKNSLLDNYLIQQLKNPSLKMILA
ncbi:MAG: transposase [Cyanobacteria bacterium P01_E01_bin.35]